MSATEQFVRCPRVGCDDGLVYETVNGIRRPPAYRCSVCRGRGFVPAGDVVPASQLQEAERQRDANAAECKRLVIQYADRAPLVAEVERLRALLRRCYPIIGPDELAEAIERELGLPPFANASSGQEPRSDA